MQWLMLLMRFLWDRLVYPLTASNDVPATGKPDNEKEGGDR